MASNETGLYPAVKYNLICICYYRRYTKNYSKKITIKKLGKIYTKKYFIVIIYVFFLS